MANRVARLAVFLLTLCCCLAACKGGDFVALVINSITPTGVVGKVGDVVIFHADVSGTGTLVYDWTLSGGGSITAGGTTDSPTVTCTTAGNFVLSLEVSDGSETATADDPITIDPAIPVITQVLPNGDVGLPAGTVIFSNNATSQPTSWLWTFTLGETSFLFTTETAEWDLPDPGTYAGTVVATNANGSSAPFPFEYTVTQPVAPSWARMELGPALNQNEGTFGGALSCVVLDGRMALLYNAPDGLRFARALVAHPANAGDWQISNLGADLLVGSNSLTVYNGHFAARFARRPGGSPNGVLCAIANVAEPTGPEDWDIHVVQEDRGGYGIATIDGALCILFQQRLPTGEEPTGFARTTAAPPTSGSDWAVHTLPEAPGADFGWIGSQMQQIGEQIVIHIVTGHEGFSSGYGVCVADTLAPNETGDWFAQESVRAAGGASSSLVDFGGRVAMFHINRTFVPTGDENLITVSETVPLTTSTTWSTYELEALASESGSEGGAASGMLSGRPYVFLTDYDDSGRGTQQHTFRLARGITVDPLQIPAGLSWEFTTIDAGRLAGRLPVSVAIGDRLIVAYVNDEPGTLHVAVSQGPY